MSDCSRPDCTLPAQEGRRCPACRGQSPNAVETLPDDTEVADLLADEPTSPLPEATPDPSTGTPTATDGGQTKLEVFR